MADGPPTMATWNLALRFVLELASLVGIGVGTWRLTPGDLRWPIAIGAPIAAAAAWGSFNVPGDPSRSGRAPVPISGGWRLVVEGCVLGAGTAGLLFTVPVVGVAAALLLIVHHVFSRRRLSWLLGNEPGETRETRPE